MMIRTQIQFTPEQMAALKARSVQSGKPVAEVVRNLVQRQLTDDADERRRTMERAKKAFGGFRDREGKTDVSANHDEYLAEAYLGR